MPAAKKLALLSVEDYLAEELASPVKHEYLGGVIYAMSGATNAHNVIAGNILPRFMVCFAVTSAFLSTQTRSFARAC
jgi:Uma2 family endonuclease